MDDGGADTSNWTGQLVASAVNPQGATANFAVAFAGYLDALVAPDTFKQKQGSPHYSADFDFYAESMGVVEIDATSDNMNESRGSLALIFTGLLGLAARRLLAK